MDIPGSLQLPTMPFAVPGAPPPSDTGSVTPPASSPPPTLPPPTLPVSSPFGGPAAAASGPMPTLASLMGGPAMPSPAPVDPASMQYATETQMDGTVLLRVQNPDGSPGPVVQIVKPPRQKQPGAPR